MKAHTTRMNVGPYVKRTLKSSEQAALNADRESRSAYRKPALTCIVCGGHNVVLYADFGITHHDDFGQTVLVGCLPCSQKAFSSWDPADKDLWDTMR